MDRLLALRTGVLLVSTAMLLSYVSVPVVATHGLLSPQVNAVLVTSVTVGNWGHQLGN